MPTEKGAKNAPNCARADGAKNNSQLLPNDIIADLQEAFNFYDKDEAGTISIPHFRNILYNFGFHRLSKREQDADLQKCDSEFLKRNCVDFTFVKIVVAHRWITRGGREEEAKECFRVFDKKDRSSVSFNDVKLMLAEYIPGVTDDEIRDFMKEIDPNNNGHIQAKDFYKFYNS